MKAFWTRLALLLALILAPAAVAAQDATGGWLGTIQPSPLITLRLAVHIKADGHGGLEGTLESLDQHATGMSLGDIAVAAGTLSFKVPAVNGAYAGRWDAAAHAWRGEWRQGASPLPLSLARPGAMARAQAPPFPPDAAIARLLDARIAGRPNEGIVVGLIGPTGRRIVARGPVGASPFNGRTLFEIGSITKVFTGLLLADMARKHEVRLDDPAGKYLPAGAALPMRNRRAVTLLDLAMQRSGLPRLPDNLAPADPANPYADYDEQRLLAFLKTYQPTRDAGARYEYSNLGVGLLGYLLARRAGSDYATLVRRRIARPLGMADTVETLTPGQRARFAAPHDEHMQPTEAWDMDALAGAGALKSDADDLLTFVAANLGLVKTPLAAAMADMRVRRAGGFAPNADIGIVWNLVRTPVGEIVFHNGATGGARAAIAFDPVRRRGVVVLVNGALEPAADDLALHLLTGSALSPAGAVPPAPPQRATIALPADRLDRLTGRYRLAPGVFLTVRRAGDGLTAQVTGQGALPIFAASPTLFFWKAVDAELTFELDSSGRATGIVLHQNGHDMPGPREP